METAMADKLNQSLIYSSGSAAYFDENFAQVLDSHLEYFKTAGSPEEREIDPRFLGQYYGDFYSVLLDLGVEARFHRIVMLLNGLTSPMQYVGQFNRVFLPDTDKITQVYGAYSTGMKRLSIGVQGD